MRVAKVTDAPLLRRKLMCLARSPTNVVILVALMCACADPVSRTEPDEPDSYAVTFVCPACADMRATDMNESGVVAGAELVNGTWTGRLWTRDSVIDLGDFIPHRVNDRLDAAGAVGAEYAAWSHETGIRPIPGVPTGIDALGRIAIEYPPAIWADGAITSLNERSDFVDAIRKVGAMNRAGDVAGSVHFVPYWTPVLFREGALVRLSLGHGRYGDAAAVNDQGDVIGPAEIAATRGAAFFLRLGQGEQYQLPFAARDLNNARQVVGDSANVAMVWQNGTAAALTTKILSTGLAVSNAVAITDAGEILARLSDGRFVRLRPISAP